MMKKKKRMEMEKSCGGKREISFKSDVGSLPWIVAVANE